MSTFFRPARGAMLPRIVPAEGLPAANSLAQASQVLGSVIGAGIAGLIFSAFGSGVMGFAIDALTFLVSFALISRIPSAVGAIRAAPHDGDVAPRGLRHSLGEGIAIVRGSRALAGTLVAAAVSMLGLGAVNVLFVPLLVNDLRVDPAWMAGIEFSQVSAMLLAAGVVAILARRLAPTTIITLGLAGIGVCIGLMSGVGAVWHVMALLFVVGWMVTPLQAMLQTIVQTASTDATRGRVVSILQASMSTASVTSMALGGLFGDLIGIRGVFLAAGIIVLVAAGISILLFRGVSGRPTGATALAATPGPA